MTNEKRMLDERLKNQSSNQRESAQLGIDNKRLTEKLEALRAEHESNQKWLKSQNDTLNRKHQVITFLRLKIQTEHIDSTCSLESELFFVSICSIRIRPLRYPFRPLIAKHLNYAKKWPNWKLI